MNLVSALRFGPPPVSSLRQLCTVLALALGSQAAFAVVIHDEAVNGDFSGSGTSPKALGALGLGNNEVYGTTGRDFAGTRDIDYFSFSIPAGYQLSEMRLLKAAPGSTGFAGLQAGGQVTLPSNASSAAGLLGWVHYTDGQIGTDILDDIGTAGNGASGFSPPLGAGTYALWVQDGNPGPLPYGFNFVVSPVPDVGSGMSELGLAILATGSYFGLSRKRASR
ncbi:MAG: hypothetical protein U1G07_16070 [Verrucomicrobiota bacterium]